MLSHHNGIWFMNRWEKRQYTALLFVKKQYNQHDFIAGGGHQEVSILLSFLEGIMCRNKIYYYNYDMIKCNKWKKLIDLSVRES